jgi:hypothetical protein
VVLEVTERPAAAPVDPAEAEELEDRVHMSLFAYYRENLTARLRDQAMERGSLRFAPDRGTRVSFAEPRIEPIIQPFSPFLQDLTIPSSPSP